jgi:outer membrane protein OmpA-like peptidoglycan-associated protein
MKKYMQRFPQRGGIFLLTLLMLVASCKSANRRTKGAAIGAGAGAAAGALIGKRSGNTATGAIIGAAVGGTAGYLIGRYMDKQAEEMQRDLKNAKVERVGEGIKITFDSNILFAINSADLGSAASANITDLAAILNKYEDTNILIEGHTDITGTREHNMGLSERRAQSVASQLRARNVDGTRISTIGYGPDQPVAENDTETGRRLNRRVEIAIFANKKLQRAAKKGDIGADYK